MTWEYAAYPICFSIQRNGSTQRIHATANDQPKPNFLLPVPCYTAHPLYPV